MEGDAHEAGDFLHFARDGAVEQALDHFAFEFIDDLVGLKQLAQRLVMLHERDSAGGLIAMRGGEAALGTAQAGEHAGTIQQRRRAINARGEGLCFGLKPSVEQLRGGGFAIHALRACRHR